MNYKLGADAGVDHGEREVHVALLYSSGLLGWGEKVDRRTGLKIAFAALTVHGLMEILGALILPFAPAEFLSAGLAEDRYFWALISAIYGVSRVIAGYATWIARKWGIAFGIALSVATIVEAPSIYPFGIMDSILAIITLISALFAWFGDEGIQER